MRVLRRAASALAALTCLIALQAHAEERISSFTADILVLPSSDIVVDEEIDVVSENRQINHGIFRDIPLKYKDEYGNRHSATIDVESVMRDGHAEPYRVERRGAGVRIRIGSADRTVSPGKHSYHIRYKSSRQLGYFKDFDEIYWNVTGTDWVFPMGEVTARVTLPQGASITSVAGYTGRAGQSGQDFRITDQTASSVTFETTRTLAPGEGLTVAVSWPKGFVAEPSQEEKARQFVSDNWSTAIGGAGLALLLLYFFLIWRKVGKDPKGGPIIAQYEAPDGFSPAACRFVERMGFDQTAFTAAIVSLAVKGALKIREDDDGTFSLEQTDDPDLSKVSKGERALWNKVFSSGQRASVTLKNTEHRRLQRARAALKDHLGQEFETEYFKHNRIYFIPGLVIAGLTVFAMSVLAAQPFVPLFMSVWLAGWSVGTFAVITRLGSTWSGVIHASSNGRKITKGGAAVFSTLFALPFVGGLVVGLVLLFTSMPILSGILMAAILVSCVAFYHWMKAPTRLGRKVMDRIEGFKLYLSVAEKDRLNFHNPPERTPELFEKFLPFALALGVEHQWGQQFDSILKSAAMGGTGTYHPAWYAGRGFYYSDFSHMGQHLSSSLGSAMVTASAAPRSSHSGSFGGGSVGGGGGGGGGGGW